MISLRIHRMSATFGKLNQETLVLSDGLNILQAPNETGKSTWCAFLLSMVFAKKAKSDNIEGGLYQSDIFSYTYKKKITLLVSKEWLSADDKVLIIDDFMANGEAMRGLCDIVKAAGASLVGIGCAVEKGFQGGGDRLRAAGMTGRQ